MNENTYYAEIIVDELHRSGVRYACIGAGSRSTPLTMAFARHTGIRSIPFVDERSAGFFAIGLSMVTRRTTVLVCTSGTALANFHPAVLEAYHSNIPILILSADRPHELRGSGANQTTDQIKFFGDSIKQFIELAPPVSQPSDKMIRYLRTTMNRVVGNTLSTPRGPVHINIPFRKPLEPDDDNRDIPDVGDGALLSYISGNKTIASNQITLLGDMIAKYTRILIIAGTAPAPIEYSEYIYSLSDKLRAPILADPASGIRYRKNSINVISFYDTFLRDMKPDAELIIQLNRPPTSKYLLEYMEKQNCMKIIIDDSALRDPSISSDMYIEAEPGRLIEKLLAVLRGNLDDSWLRRWQELDAMTESRIAELCSDNFFEGSILRRVFNHEIRSVFIANSLAIRHLDQFVPGSNHDIDIYCNRGLSGIDGNISTAAGISLATNSRTYAIIGDLTFIHDLGAMLVLSRDRIRLTIILINNHGGGIFQRLPISSFDPEFTKYFVTPHDTDFGSIATGFGIRHDIVHNLAELDAMIEETVDLDGTNIIELNTDIKQTQDIIDRLVVED